MSRDLSQKKPLILSHEVTEVKLNQIQIVLRGECSVHANDVLVEVEGVKLVNTKSKLLFSELSQFETVAYCDPDTKKLYVNFPVQDPNRSRKIDVKVALQFDNKTTDSTSYEFEYTRPAIPKVVIITNNGENILTNTTTPSLHGKCVEEKIESIEVRIDNGSWVTGSIICQNGEWNYVLPPLTGTPPTNHVVEIRTVNTNSPDIYSEVEVIEILVDTEAPTNGPTIQGVVGGSDVEKDQWLGALTPHVFWTHDSLMGQYKAVIKTADLSTTVCNEKIISAPTNHYEFKSDDCQLSLVNNTQYVIQIWSYDLATNISTQPSQYLFMVDRTLPTIHITNQPPVITKSVVADFSFNIQFDIGSSQLGSSHCQIDNLPFTNCNLSISYQNLAAGNHIFRIRATDLAGNTALQSYSWDVQSDTIVPICSFATSDQSFINSSSITFNYLCTDDDLISIVECQMNNGAWQVCPTSTATTLNGLMTGTYKFSVRAKDQALNTSVIIFDEFVVDQEAPSINLTMTPQNPTNLTQANFTFSSLDLMSGISSTECNLDGAGFSVCTSPYFISGPLTEATHTLFVRAVDLAGNIGTPTAFTWVIDTTPPNTPILPADTDGGLQPLWTWSSGGGGNGQFRFKLDDTDLTSGTQSTTQLFFQTPTDLSFGNHTIYVQERDSAGNWSNSGDQTLTIKCSPGSFYNGSSCTSCPIGYYQPSPNLDNACIGASISHYVAVVGSTSESSCTNKPNNALSVTYGASFALGSNNCPIASVGSCDSGYLPDGSNCRSLCGEGLYWNGSSCSAVGVGYYSPISDDSRYLCPANSTTVGTNSSSLNDCVANAGYFDCQDGTCNLVGVGYYSAGSTNNRTQCPINSTTIINNATSVADCLASAGYYHCQDGICDNVGIGYYSPANDNLRYSCAQYRSTATANSDDVSDCLAVAGYYGPVSIADAVDVGAGYYSPALDNLRYQCAAGYYCSSNNNTLPTGDGICSSGYYCPEGSTDAQGGPNGGACPAGYQCPAGTGVLSAASICGANLYSDGGTGSCLSCPVNSVTVGTTAADHDSINDCFAVAGYYNCQDGTCDPVGAGFYSPAADNNRYQCAAGQFGSTQQNTNSSCDGSCDAGYFCLAGSVSSSGSGVCDANTYSTGGATNSTCTSCPLNSSTNGVGVSAHDQLSDCFGNAGYYNCEDGTCDPANVGYYSPAFDNLRYQCPVGATTMTTTASSINDCVAGAGYYDCDDGVCDVVGVGFYSPVNDNSRYACPLNTESTGSGLGADDVSDCMAVVDYWDHDSNDANAAVAVGDGFYSPYRDNNIYTCTNVPSHATSVIYSGPGNGSNNCPINSVVTCDIGYIPNGTTCFDNTPSSISFTNQTNVERSSTITSNDVVVTSFDGSMTATCTGCSAIARNGVWGGTSVSGFISGDTLTIRLNSSANFNTSVSASVTIGATTSSSWVVTTRQAYDCTATPWGTIAHNSNVTGYSTDLPNSTCASVSEVRSCFDGTLSGTFAHTTCSNGCTTTPWGDVSSGYTNVAYSNTTPSGACSSVSQTRTCTNGVLSGSFTNTTCTDGCSLPWGGAITHGQNTIAFSTSTPTDTCSSVDETRICNSGVLSGSYTNATCLDGCTATPWGNVASGYSNTAFNTSASASCIANSETRTCNNGSLSGSFTFTTCADGTPDPIAFTNLNNQNLNSTITSNAVTVGDFNEPLTATCSGCVAIARNGTWGGTTVSGFVSGDTIAMRVTSSSDFSTAVNASATLGATTSSSWSVTTRAAYNCTPTAWGTITHGSSVTAFLSSTPTPPTICNDVSETRTCTDGVLSGSFSNTNCNEGCSTTPWGAVASGYSNTAFSTSSPTAACSTVSETRTCTNGVLSGSYTITSCSSGCTSTPWGNVASGYSDTAYSTNLPTAACSTVSQTRTCTNGTLSGTYTNASCSDGCTGTPWGNVASGYSGTAYSTSPSADCSVVSQTRTCTNGTLSGTYTLSSCLDNGPNSFSFTNSSGQNLSTTVSSNAVTVSGFDGPLTATCTGCSAIARNGVWGGTSVSGFMSGDTIAIQVTSSSSYSTAINATASLGVTTSSTWIVTTRAANNCTGTPWGTVNHGSTVTAYANSTPTPPTSCAGITQSRTCTDGTLSGSYTATTCSDGCSSTPWGNVTSGFSSTAYSSSANPNCSAISEVRTCTNGTMSGSYTNTSCTDNAPDAFSFTNVSGQNLSSTITSNAVTLTGFGGSLTATCSGCTAIARNGSWGGTSVSGFVSGDNIAIRLTSSSSYSTAVNASATVGVTTSASWSVTTRAASNCTGTPWGTINHGSSVTAYSSTNPTPPSTCGGVSQTRTCSDGTLSGSYTGTSCSEGCSGTPWGNVASGYSNTAYSTSSPAAACSTVSQTRTCTNGTMSGTYTNTSCASGCTGTPWGSVTSGYSNTAYSTSTPAAACSTVSQTRTCTNGTLSGSYTSTSCTSGCTGTPWGSVASGYSNTAYSTSSPSGSCSTVSETRTCSAGSMSGSYTNTSCSSGCSLPWGGSITSGNSTTAYSTSSPTGACSSYSEIRTCSNGSLSGSYTNQSCTSGCTGTPWGNVASGYSNTAYSTSSPTAACSTVSQTRTCTSGTMSGSYTTTSCTSGCTGTPWGSVASGFSGTAYSASSAPDCTAISQTRTCTNGSMSGSYTITSCTNSSPCNLPWGGTINHGQSVTAYASTAPTYSGACTSETRTCSNGTLSGSYTNQNCTRGCAATNLNGNSLPNAYDGQDYNDAPSCSGSERVCEPIWGNYTCSGGSSSSFGTWSGTPASQLCVCSTCDCP